VWQAAGRHQLLDVSNRAFSSVRHRSMGPWWAHSEQQGVLLQLRSKAWPAKVCCSYLQVTMQIRLLYLPILELSWSCFAAFSDGVKAYGELWVPDETGQIPLITAGQAPAAANYSSSDDHTARTPPPDLPSLLLDSRIVFLGMPVRFLHHIGQIWQSLP
jgi:hypothetical protein